MGFFRSDSPCHRSPRCNRSARRPGVTILEIILVMPILVILLMAIVEFGLILANLKQIAVSSRVGSDTAAQTPALPATGTVPANIVTAVQQQLQSSGMSACRIILVHNTSGSTVTLVSDIGAGCTCTSPTTPALPASGKFVRLTVCLELTELTPNLLGTLGFDISSRMAEETTTMRYEL